MHIPEMPIFRSSPYHSQARNPVGEAVFTVVGGGLAGLAGEGEGEGEDPCRRKRGRPGQRGARIVAVQLCTLHRRSAGERENTRLQRAPPFPLLRRRRRSVYVLHSGRGKSLD